MSVSTNCSLIVHLSSLHFQVDIHVVEDWRRQAFLRNGVPFQDNNAPASHHCSQYPFLTTSISEFWVPDAALACRGQNCLVSHHEMWLDSNVYLFPVTTVPSWLDAKHLGCSTNFLSLCCDFSAEGKKFLKSIALKFMCAMVKNKVCFKSHSHTLYIYAMIYIAIWSHIIYTLKDF